MVAGAKIFEGRFAMKLRHRFFGFMLVVLWGSQPAFAAESWLVTASLRHDGREFARPSVVVDGNTSATIESSGPDRYTLSLVASGQPDDAVKVDVKLDTDRGELNPTVVVKRGEPGLITMGPLAIELTVQRHDP